MNAKSVLNLYTCKVFATHLITDLKKREGSHRVSLSVTESDDNRFGAIALFVSVDDVKKGEMTVWIRGDCKYWILDTHTHTLGSDTYKRLKSQQDFESTFRLFMELLLDA